MKQIWMRILRAILRSLPGLMVFGLLCNLSCQNQNEEDLFGSICDTTTVSWTQDIEPIIQSKCLHCHYDQSPITPFSLQGYQNVLIRVNTGQLEPAINHTGPVMMPKDGPKLPECELSKINKWIREGAANN